MTGGVAKKSDRLDFEDEILDFSNHHAAENGRKIILKNILKKIPTIFILLVSKALQVLRHLFR